MSDGAEINVSEPAGVRQESIGKPRHGPQRREVDTCDTFASPQEVDVNLSQAIEGTEVYILEVGAAGEEAWGQPLNPGQG